MLHIIIFFLKCGYLLYCGYVWSVNKEFLTLLEPIIQLSTYLTSTQRPLMKNCILAILF